MIKMTDTTIEDGRRVFRFALLSPEAVPCGELKLEIVGEMCSVHIEVQKWGSKLLNSLVADWISVVVPFIQDTGCKKIIASYEGEPEEVEKWKKFIHKFGFPEPKTLYVATIEV